VPLIALLFALTGCGSFMLTQGKCVASPNENAWASYKLCSKEAVPGWRACGCVGIDLDVLPGR